MQIALKTSTKARRVWLSADDGDFETFRSLVDRDADPADWPLADRIERSVPIYAGARVRAAAGDAQDRRSLMAEWVEVFASGPGVIVIDAAFADSAVIDRASAIFTGIIEAQHRAGRGGGDHFARPGANDRIWNALEKHCLADPENFALYYGNEAIALASEAWLGTDYQMTAQVNRVNPGGAAQTPHRDYHLGFMTPAQMASFPAHVHRLSSALTLQGGVAHCDMPVETGPTMVLPFSQLFLEGYLAFHRPEFQTWFQTRHVQMPLAKGDVMFFNPAVMHGAGANRSSDRHRMANLLQVSSAMGRAMERVDRTGMSLALYPVLAALADAGRISDLQVDNAIASCAEGYSFPTDLDRDPPIGGLAPQTQATLMREAFRTGTSMADFAARVRERSARLEPVSIA